MFASWGIGLLALRQGDLPRALPLLERAVGICQDADLPVYFPRMAAALGAAYTLGGRVADAVPLLTQAMEQTIATETVGYQALCRLSLGEAQLLAGRLEEAHALAERALALAREHQERGHQAYALRLLGEIAARREPPERDQAEAHYRQALALAEELGMRPLHGPLPPRPRHAVCHDRTPRRGPRRTVRRRRAVPRHGDDLLAAPGGGGAGAGGGVVMEFYDVLDQVVALLQRRGRVTYNALKLQFHLDDDQLAVLKDELLYAYPQVVDDAGRGLHWTGDTATTQVPAPPAPQHEPPPVSQTDHPPQDAASHTTPRPPEAERRQLTVLFCDLADSTRLSGQLDPEDLREVVRAYQATCAEVIQRFEGHIAQYLGDGLLVYFGYPQAHEDDAQRAVRTGLGILDAMATLNARLEQTQGPRLAVRIGIHTGLVVVGTMGNGGRHEQLALGETPNLAARLQSLTAPDTLAISDTTHRLVQGYVRGDDLGLHRLKGVETPMRVYRVVGESAAQSRLDVAGGTGLTPLVGREHEVGLLRERWAQSQDGLGQVVLLSGEAGIGKSRLVRVLTEHVADVGAPRLTLRCSPYHTNSALLSRYPAPPAAPGVAPRRLSHSTSGHAGAGAADGWPAPGRGGAAAGCPPHAAGAGALSTADPESAAPEAEDAGGAGGVAAG